MGKVKPTSGVARSSLKKHAETSKKYAQNCRTFAEPNSGDNRSYRGGYSTTGSMRKMSSSDFADLEELNDVERKYIRLPPAIPSGINKKPVNSRKLAEDPELYTNYFIATNKLPAAMVMDSLTYYGEEVV